MDIRHTLKKMAGEAAAGERLKAAGFFLMNFTDGSSSPSALMVRLGWVNGPSEGFPGPVHPDDEAGFRAQWSRMDDGRQDTFHAEYRVRDTVSGDWCWVLTHGAVLSREQGRVAVYAGVDLDITAQKTSEAMVRDQLYHAESVFHQAESLRVVSLLANATQDVGKTINLVLGHAQGLLAFEAAQVSVYREGTLQELGSRVGTNHTETDHPRPAGHPVWAVCSSRSPVLQGDLKTYFRSWLGVPLVFRGEFLGVVEFWHQNPRFFRSDKIWPAMGFADSIAESMHTARTVENLRADARTDALTGLFTRRHLQDAGPEVFDRCLDAGQPLALIFVDIDYFKDINDRHGHLVGDAVLMTIAQLCRNVLRKDDLFFRYGGEEFVALLPDADGALSRRVAERLRETAAAARFRGLDRGETVSVGVVPVAPGHKMGFEQLLQEADQAMYQAKAEGRDRVTISERWAAAIEI